MVLTGCFSGTANPKTGLTLRCFQSCGHGGPAVSTQEVLGHPMHHRGGPLWLGGRMVGGLLKTHGAVWSSYGWGCAMMLDMFWGWL